MRDNPRLLIADQLESLAVAMMVALIPVLVLGLGCGPAGGPKGSLDVNGASQGGAAGISRVQVGLASSGQSQGGGGGGGPKIDALREAHVVIDNVSAHTTGGGGWVTVRDGIQVDVDVLRLGDFAVDLGFGDLPAGKITQIRLHVSLTGAPPYVITADGTQVPMKVPSGYQSGIKVKGLWDADACSQLLLNLDLDGKKSIWIHPTGHGDLYVMRPVIRVGGSSSRPIAGCRPGNPNGPNDPNDPNSPGTDHPGNPNHPNNPNNPNNPTDPNDPTDPSGSGTPDGANGGSPTDGDGTLGDPTDDGTVNGDPNGGGSPTGTDVPTTDGSGTNDPNGSTGTSDPSGGGTTGLPDDGAGTGTPNGGVCGTNTECNIGAYCAESGICIAL